MDDTGEVGVEIIDPLVAGTSGQPLKYALSKSRSAKRQARDDVGRWRKIYYRLRQGGASEASVQRAYRMAKDAERRAELGVLDPKAKTEDVRKGLAKTGVSSVVDERVESDLIREAMEAAKLARRLEVMGGDTKIHFNALPQDIQDAFKQYLRNSGLEPRIVKHFEPFVQGKVDRSVSEILNMVDRTVIDNQVYRKGYDQSH